MRQFIYRKRITIKRSELTNYYKEATFDAELQSNMRALYFFFKIVPDWSWTRKQNLLVFNKQTNT